MGCYKGEKIGLVEQNQDFRGHSIYDEWRNYSRTYFSGERMMIVTINYKFLNLKIFCWLSILHLNQENFKIVVKNDTPSGAQAPARGTIFLSEILMLVSSISYLSMGKIAKWFFDRKTFRFFKIVRFKISKILKFCSLREIFSVFFRW